MISIDLGGVILDEATSFNFIITHLLKALLFLFFQCNLSNVLLI